MATGTAGNRASQCAGAVLSAKNIEDENLLAQQAVTEIPVPESQFHYG